MAHERARVVLLGVHGHGQWHLANVIRLSGEGRTELVGVADPRPPTPAMREAAGADVLWSADAATLIAQARPDVTIVCTPIPMHLQHARLAMQAGSHVLLEKPPTPTWADFVTLSEEVAASARACQVGFQGLGSDLVSSVADDLASGRIGAVRAIGVFGAWVRDRAYFTRAPWAGHRVVDGAVTNPFAHGVAAALRLDGSQEADQVTGIECELFHAHDIESDDTSTVRIHTARGTTITVAVTLCASDEQEPRVIVRGDRGTAEVSYTRDCVAWDVQGQRVGQSGARTDLLENLLDHIDDRAVALMVPLSAAAGFMSVLEAIRLAPDPRRIDPAHIRCLGTGPAGRLVLPGIESVLLECVSRGALLSELAVPWALQPAASGSVGSG
jgi:predicted dehydrogenase